MLTSKEARLRLAATRRARGRDPVKAVTSYLRGLGGNRIGRLLRLIENESPEVFWPIFVECWPYGRSNPSMNKRLLRALQRVGPHDSIKQLPATLNVYRGAPRACIDDGLCWTTDLTVATKFARGFHYLNGPGFNPCIAAARIRRRHAYWYSGDGIRYEHEVICRPSSWRILPEENYIDVLVKDTISELHRYYSNPDHYDVDCELKTLARGWPDVTPRRWQLALERAHSTIAAEREAALAQSLQERPAVTQVNGSDDDIDESSDFESDSDFESESDVEADFEHDYGASDYASDYEEESAA